MSYVNYSISYSNEFEITRIALYGIIGFTTTCELQQNSPLSGAFAISSNILLMYFTVRQSSSLSSEYVKVILILKILQLVYDLQTCFFFIIAPIFPCKAVYLRGIGAYLRLNGHIPFVINLTTLSLISAWFNCCLFHRYQVILPFDHKAKLRRLGIYGVYLLMNTVMMINPIAFTFSTTNDEDAQREIVANSPMAWLLDVSFKIYTNDNCPLFLVFHLPLLLTTFGLCTFTTTVLTTHARVIMNARRNQISVTTIVMQQRLINSLHFQMNVTTLGMGVPTIYWVANVLIGFVLPSKMRHKRSFEIRETISFVTSLIMLMIPFSSCCNSVYAIVSTKSSVDFIMAFLRIRKTVPSVNPQPSMTGLTVVNANNPNHQNRRRG